jgi:hypothetical protein
MTDFKDEIIMTVDEFAAVLQKDIDEFITRWKQGVENEPKFHPDTMDLNSWYEQWEI